MNNTPNSGGRKKTLSPGSGSVRKTEKVNTSGPVGRKDGYAGRRTEQSSGQNSSGQNSGGQRAGGTGLLGLLLGSGGGLKRIIMLVVIVLVILFVFKVCFGGCSIPEMAIDEETLNSYTSGSSSGSSGSTGSSSGGTTFGGSALDDWSELFLSDSYDETDSIAPAAVSATTSAQSAVTTVSNRARDKYTTLLGNGRDEVTLMVYMCGTDLESQNGMGTADLNEMLHATIDDDRVNVIVETGGTKKWNNTVISNSTNQIYRVTNRGLQALEKNLGKKSMVDPNTLIDFIDYCTKNYPANRYGLILWDHGGGAISGYGYDEQFKSAGSMTLDRVNYALKSSGIQFDFIGFDACLMATLETALVCEPYADYLLASEEAEPGCGWYYTNWLTELSKNTSTPTVTLAKTIIDDFNNVCRKNYPGCNTTLSVVDLAELSGTVPEPFAAFSRSMGALLDNQDYKTVASARSAAREFGKTSRINHVDLVDLAYKVDTPEADALVSALKGCIKYNRTSTSMAKSYGLSIYFPYSSFKNMNSAVKLYDSIGMDAGYTDCIRSFASLAAGGQIATGGTTSSPINALLGNYTDSTGFSSSSMLEYLLDGYMGGGTSSSSGSLLGGSSSGAGSLLGGLLSGSLGSTASSGIDPTDLLSGILGGSDYSGWFDGERVLRNADYYDANALYTSDMLLTEKNGGHVLSLSPEKWAMVKEGGVLLNVFYDDGKGYIDLGLDNVYAFDGDGDLKIEWDGTWVALDGHIVPFYVVDDTKDNGIRTTIGRVPARLNGELVYVMVEFEDDTSRVLGAQRLYENGETDTVAKGLIPLNKGDVLEFVCDYYGYDGTYDASYLLADPLTVTGEITVTNLTVDGSCVFCYCLEDLYENEFWTETQTLVEE